MPGVRERQSSEWVLRQTSRAVAPHSKGGACAFHFALPNGAAGPVSGMSFLSAWRVSSGTGDTMAM